MFINNRSVVSPYSAPLGPYPASWKRFDGPKTAFSGRSGAKRDAVHRASVATHPRGRFAAPSAGFFGAVASPGPIGDAQASPCGAR